MTRLHLLIALLLGPLALVGCPPTDDDDSGDDDDSPADDDDSPADDDDTPDDDDSAADDDDSAASMLEVDVSQLINPLDHGFGTSPCPTPMGTIRLTNGSIDAHAFEILSQDSAESLRIIDLSLTDVGPGGASVSGDVPAGGSQTIHVGFNCASSTATQTSTVDGHFGPTTIDIPITVNVN
jgi:hypothetical protein